MGWQRPDRELGAGPALRRHAGEGPYSHWRHVHEFIPLANGTLMRDVVRYRLPLGWLGSALAGWKVESQVDRIFAHRATKIADDSRAGLQCTVRCSSSSTSAQCA